jgi:transposase
MSVMAAELSAWRDAFLAAGEATLETRPADGRDLEIGRLKAKVGELTMANELLDAGKPEIAADMAINPARP